MRGLVCGFLLLLMTESAFAAAPNDLSRAWQTLTRIDVEAAYDLLKDNHPAALPEVGDTQFTQALAAAHAKALARVPAVASYEGYIATMSEFANAMGALNCTRLGARGGIATAPEARALIERGERRTHKDFVSYAA